MRKLIGLLLITIFCTFFANGSDGKPHRVVKRLPAATKTEASKPAKSSDTAEEPFSKPTPILDSTDGNSSGVNITTAAWDSAIHVDPTYYAFAQAHKEQFNKYDFYYRLEIVPQFRPSFEACKSQNDFLSFFEKLFKTEDGALVSVTANIQHRWSSGSATNIFNGDAALVLAAKGASIKGNPGTGCFFDFTARPSFPWITWNGGRAGRDMYDDFQIKF